MHRHFATLFDKNYAAKGLALYHSLCAHSSETFTLHLLALDEETFWLFSYLDFPEVQLIPAHSFEWAMKLGEIKQSREWREYCWTCASSLMEYLLSFPGIEQLTYIDSDVFFFSDPKQIFEEMRSASIGITPHRFNKSTPAHVLNNGQFNVGIVVASNNEVGRQCIRKWASQVRDWCYDRREHEHQCGDQKYLDEWPVLYWDSLRILDHPGINLGPWAIGNYEIDTSRDYHAAVTVGGYPLIAYHYHEFKDPEHLTNWRLRFIDIALIYRPYIEAWKLACAHIAQTSDVIQKRRERQQLQAERV